MSHNYSLSMIFILMMFFLTISCNTDNIKTVTDIDGNTYRTVTIGDQIWMAENLKVTRFRNGDTIPNIMDSLQWCKTESAAWCNYNNDTAIGKEYGRLYNWYAISDGRNIAPEGWHIPSFEEVEILYKFLGDDILAAGMMKEAGNKHWIYPNIWASNKSGFTAFPGGYRFTNTASEYKQGGSFHTLGSNGYWWTTSLSFEMYASSARLFYGFANVDRELRDKTYGFSVRCIKDKNK